MSNTKAEFKFNEDMFENPATFRAVVIGFFNLVTEGQIQGGYLDIFINDKNLNIAYVNEYGCIVVQKSYTIKERGESEKG